MAEKISAQPPVDSLRRAAETEVLLAGFGRTVVTSVFRDVLSARRAERSFDASAKEIIGEAADRLAIRFSRSQRPVLNMTGTVLHTKPRPSPVAR
jgi:hypothetical protein